MIAGFRQPDPAATDLHRVAIHEAGHATVGEHLSGAPARVDIWRSHRSSDQFMGLCHFPASVLRGEHRRQIGLAGAVAEALAANAHFQGYWLALTVDPLLSHSDRLLAGAYDQLSVAVCAHHIRRLWSGIHARAQIEISKVHQREAAASLRHSY